MGLRRKAREIVLQVLYNLDYNQESPLSEKRADEAEYQPILKTILDDNAIKADHSIAEFSEAVLSTVIGNIIPIDDMIKSHLENWTIDKLAILDRNLLRIATAEIVFHRTHPAIVINEALEIAKKYCGDQTGKLLNGVLDNLVKDITAE